MPLLRRSPRTHRATGPRLSTRVRNALHGTGNGRTHRQNRVAGLKAARTNPRTTGEGRRHAKHELKAMGHKPNKVPLGTRIRHFLHLPGKTHNTRRSRRT